MHAQQCCYQTASLMGAPLGLTVLPVGVIPECLYYRFVFLSDTATRVEPPIPKSKE